MHKSNWFKVPAIAASLAFATLSGCVTSHVMVGRARPPISPDQVQIYLHPPAGKYEEIALLDTSSRNSFSITAQAKTNAEMQRLKEEAASLGANGILLNAEGDQAAGPIGTEFGAATASGHSAFCVGIGRSATTFL